MLERTLAAKGALGGSEGGGVARAASEASTSAAAASAGAGAAGGGRGGGPRGGSPPPGTPASPPPGGPSRTISDVGTPLSGLSSVGVEVGSLGSTPKVLDSQPPQGPQSFRR